MKINKFYMGFVRFLNMPFSILFRYFFYELVIKTKIELNFPYLSEFKAFIYLILGAKNSENYNL